jgi:hypothetical protein
MDFGALLKGLAGVYSAVQGVKAGNAAKRAAARDDAMRPYRAGYAAQLAALSADPSKIKEMPGYKFALQQGEETLQRRAGAQGKLGSGSEKSELAQFSEMFAGQYLQSEQQRLAGLAGADLPPTALAGQLEANKLRSQSLASLGYGLEHAYKAYTG